MNDDQLQLELQSRIPEPTSGYWDSIDARLAEIERNEDFDHAATAPDIAPVPEPETPNTKTSLWARRPMLVAAMLLAVVAIGSTIFALRSGPDDFDLVSQPAPETVLDALQLRLSEGEEKDPVSYCFQASEGTRLVGSDPSVRRTRRGAELSIGSAGDVTILAWDLALNTPAILGATQLGEADGAFEVAFDILHTAAGDFGDSITHDVVITNDSLSVRETTMIVVDCAAMADEMTIVANIIDAGPVAVRLPDEAPARWRTLDDSPAALEFRVTPGDAGEIVSSSFFPPDGLVGTGSRASVDDTTWIELDVGPVDGWVSTEFIEPDVRILDQLCFNSNGRFVVIEPTFDGATFTGGVRLPRGQVRDFFAVSGQRIEADTYRVESLRATFRSAEIEEWTVTPDGAAIEGGRYRPVDCAESSYFISQIDHVLTTLAEPE